MGALIDLTGKRFGRLVVLERRGIDKRGKPVWFCRCDCGVEKLIGGQSLKEGKSSKKGGAKSCGCLNTELRYSRKMKRHPGWKGGKYNSRGYNFVRDRNHPNSQHNGYVLEHMRVMSNHIGRPLKKGETVHHKNGIKDDNRIENLELWVSAHPKGSRISDLTEFAVEHLQRYAPEKLSNDNMVEFSIVDIVLDGGFRKPKNISYDLSAYG